MSSFDVVVVGAGHAGCEAASAAARLGRRVACVTFRREHVGRLSCNPAIGGLAKGHLVREIDALGGLMGRAADATCIQFRRLNTRRGLAVQASRAQVDIDLYPQWMRATLEATPNLTIIEAEVAALRVVGGRVAGVTLADGAQLDAPSVILTTGTFLAAVMHRGAESTVGGRLGDDAAARLAASVRELGLRVGRLKTGTVPRLDAATIDWRRLEPQLDVFPEGRFSFGPRPPKLPQVTCFQAWTHAGVHDLVRRGLDRSPLYSGAITGRGPRYCPSIEDKVIRFPDRDRHLLFLEPEGLSSRRVYLNGLSTSLPTDVQDQIVATILGLEHARVLQHGYAVEYDYSDPTQLDHGLQHREVRGLFCAGQINGTSGYEEAAAQGLIAGISAARGEVFPVERAEAYLGVLIDDLVTRGIGGEPYRMFSSRAEHRILLREDNADRRLMPRGRDLGLVDDVTWDRFSARQEAIERGHRDLRAHRLTPTEETQRTLARLGLGRLNSPATLAEVLGRPAATWSGLAAALPMPPVSPEVAEQLEIDCKYHGYIEVAERRAARERAADHVPLPPDLDWAAVPALSQEIRERLAAARPATLAAAARLPGITPAALSVVAGWMLRRMRTEGRA